MNIKGVLGSMLPTQIRAKEKAEKTIKSDNTGDRDANGQTPFGKGEKKHPPMNEEQKKKALEHLKNLAVVKDNSLSVEWAQYEGREFVIVKEPTGKVVRRIPEEELWTLQVVKDSEKGQLLRKTA